jgi:hypothetical protein
MNYDQIARALAAGPGLEEFHALIHACEARRQEIRARDAAIANVQPPAARPLLRQQAMDKGLDAVEKLDREIEANGRELALLDALEARINDAHEQALTEKARREIPLARKQLPRRIGEVRAALAALDAALADLDGTVATLAEYDRLPDRAMPLNDTELADLLTLRDEVWLQRNAAALMPNRETHPQSWAIANVEKANGDWHPKRPGVWLPDFVN